MDKILMWKRYTNSGFKLMKFANPFPPASLLHFLLFKGFQPGSMFCHLLGGQHLRFACFIYLLIFGPHLSLLLIAVSIKHQPTYTENENTLELLLQFLDVPSHFSVALLASFDFLPLGTVLSDFLLF